MAQLQLLQEVLAPKDVVFTPEWAAQDIVEYFQPSGRILEPCKGSGAFMKFMPTAEWCEINEGRDFFAYNEKVNWIVSNPPFSLLHDWLQHSFSIANEVAYLIPLWKFFGSYALMKVAKDFGNIKHIRVYGTGGRLNFPLGNTVGVVHWSRSYGGDTSWSWYEPNNRLQPTAFGVGQPQLFSLLGGSQAEESPATNGGG